MISPTDTAAGAGMRHRGWSRAGAIAAVLATRPTTRLARFSTRVGLLAAGSVLTAVAVGITLWTGLGPGPLDVFIGAVRVRTGLALGVTIWLVVGALIAVAWSLGRRPGPGTLLAPLLMGPTMQVVVEHLESVAVPGSLFVRVAIHLTAIAMIGIGAGALIVSGLGAGSGELLAVAASDRTGKPEPRVRMVSESVLLAVGVVLGGPAGLGTVLVAVAIGPAVVYGYRLVSLLTEHTPLGQRRLDPALV